MTQLEDDRCVSSGGFHERSTKEAELAFLDRKKSSEGATRIATNTGLTSSVCMITNLILPASKSGTELSLMYCLAGFESSRLSKYQLAQSFAFQPRRARYSTVHFGQQTRKGMDTKAIAIRTLVRNLLHVFSYCKRDFLAWNSCRLRQSTGT